MEHIIISPGKMKLMLTRADLEHYELELSSLDSEDTVTRRAFRELLDDVKEMSGFDASDDKVFIQLYPSRDGGAEIYITRLTAKREAEGEKEPEFINISTVYGFGTLSDMISACAHTKDEEMPDLSSAWSGEGGYYLLAEDIVPYRNRFYDKKRLKKHHIIGDYGKIIDNQTAVFYVKEHCFCFCEKNAVKMLGSML